MCHGHSHILCEITGHLRVGESDLLEVRMVTPLEMRLPYGEKLIKSKHSALWVPVSPMVPLPASTQALMAVSFTPLFYTVDTDMTTTHAMAQRRQSAGVPGPTSWSGWDTSQPRGGNNGDSDGDVPW